MRRGGRIGPDTGERDEPVEKKRQACADNGDGDGGDQNECQFVVFHFLITWSWGRWSDGDGALAFVCGGARRTTVVAKNKANISLFTISAGDSKVGSHGSDAASFRDNVFGDIICYLSIVNKKTWISVV